MSYLPHFDPDIFVSYSHGRLFEGRAPLRDWTKALIRRLEYLLSLDKEFDNLNLWMDPQIDPTAFLSDDLKTKASACGVLMIVMSDRYIESSWCRDELDWFKRQVRDRAGASGRIFVLRAQKTDTALWPDFLRDERGHALVGFSFYDSESGTPWDYPDLREPNADFGKELLRLHTWLTKRLRELRGRAAKQAQDHAAQPPPRPAGPKLIYLHAPPDCDSARAKVDQALKSDDIATTTAEHSDGADVSAWQRETKRRITIAKHCEALALLRAGDEDRFVDDLLGIGVNERKVMSDARGAPLPCAVLDTIGSGLPVDLDLARFGIERFDLNQADWRGRFRSWLDASARAAL